MDKEKIEEIYGVKQTAEAEVKEINKEEVATVFAEGK